MDLAAAQKLFDGSDEFLEVVAYHLQQSAEKFLKAFLVYHETDFPKSHDIKEILVLVDNIESPLAESCRDAEILTAYAFEARYPGSAHEIERAEVERAVSTVLHVRNEVLKRLPDYSKLTS